MRSYHQSWPPQDFVTTILLSEQQLVAQMWISEKVNIADLFKWYVMCHTGLPPLELRLELVAARGCRHRTFRPATI